MENSRKLNSGREVHLSGKWENTSRICQSRFVSHLKCLIAVFRLKVCFLNCRVKKAKVTTVYLFVYLFIFILISLPFS